MPIEYDSTFSQFHLFNDDISYIFNLLPNQQLGHIYFGQRISKLTDTTKFRDFNYRDMSPVVDPSDISFSLDNIRQELSIYGKGDLRSTGLKFVFENGETITNFKYIKHEIFKGKRPFASLPSTYVDDNEDGTSLWIYLEDEYHPTEIILKYFIFENEAMLTRGVEIKNKGSQEFKLENAQSFNLDFPDMDFTLIALTGAWSRERHIEEHKLHRGIQEIYSIRGHSSHQYNPFIALRRENCTEKSGEVYGFNLIYSGNFSGKVDVDNYDHSRLLMGINPSGFSWTLKKDEFFETPEVAMVYSNKGLNGMSQTFHKIYNNHLVRGYWKSKTRPILLNSWEGTYMDFDEKKILQLAEDAVDLGIDLFVLDDGWFGKRDDVKSSLGDWEPNFGKLPNGVKGLSEKIHSLGLKFGLWFEPEMISKNSHLYQKHPEWILGDYRKKLSVGRYQYYLDFSNPVVVDYLFEKMAEIIEDGQLDYIKWDLNRSMSEVYSSNHSAAEQGKVYHKAVLGMYALHDRLLKAFPRLLIESCASGGARFDPGMLYYAPQGWLSDDTDALERTKIQYGSSLVYPLSTMGAHVSAVPNHQTGRSTSLEFRSNVAYFGIFGYELDTTKLNAAERAEVKEQITFMKKHQKLIQYGQFYRLLSPFKNHFLAWMVMSKDGGAGILGVYQLHYQINKRKGYLKLQGLVEDALYELQIEQDVLTYSGGELMNIGIPLSKIINEVGDYKSKVLLMTKIK